LSVFIPSPCDANCRRFYEQLVSPLTPDERDRYCEDAAEFAVALGAAPDEVPRSWAAVRIYLEHRYESGEIVVGQQALTLAASLLSPVRPKLLVTPAVSTLAAGLLPVSVRAQYGFPWNRQRERWFRRTIAFLRFSRRVLPLSFTQWRSARMVDGMTIRHDYSAAR